MNILIPIETSCRELIYKVNLCHYFALEGFRCFLGRKSYISYLIENLKGYIYLDKGYHKGESDKIYKKIKQNEGYIVNLEEEGGVDYNDNSTLLGRYSKELFDNADLILFWGEKQQKIVANNMNSSISSVITGHPRFELLKPQFHYFYKDEVEKILNKYGEFILVNTNMSFGNNIRGDKFVEENYHLRFKRINKMITFDKMKLEAFRLLILNIFEKLGKTIILRPHPEEDKEFYLNAFKGNNKIHVIFEDSVVPWLLAAQVMIHPDCTTAIESIILGKKPISYLPNEYPKSLVTKLPLEASSRFCDQKKLVEFLKNTKFNLQEPDPNEYPFLEENFCYSNSSIKLIVDQMLKLKNQTMHKGQMDLSTRDKLVIAYLSLKTRLTKNKPAKVLSLNKLKGFDKKHMHKLRKILLTKNVSLTKVNCQSHAEGLFVFSKR